MNKPKFLPVNTMLWQRFRTTDPRFKTKIKTDPRSVHFVCDIIEKRNTHIHIVLSKCQQPSASSQLIIFVYKLYVFIAQPNIDFISFKCINGSTLVIDWQACSCYSNQKCWLLPQIVCRDILLTFWKQTLLCKF